MLRNYFRTALRSFIKNKAFTAINTFGLAVGIGSFILLASYLYNEWSYDRFNDKADRICRVKMMYSHGEGKTVDVALTPAVLAPTFKREFPEVAEAVRVYNVSPVQVQYEDKIFNEKKFLYGDEGFFNVFSFPLKQGNAATVLKDPNTIVLSEDAARKYFGNTNPVGKVLKLNDNRQMLVTGVAANIPGNSQVKFDFVAAFSTLKAAKSEVWSNANYVSYILVQKKENIATVQRKSDALVKKEYAGDIKRGGMMRFELEPLTKVHLHSTASNGLEVPGNATATYILALVGILLLLVACINYMNLATARSAERAQEIGVRKTLGAVKYQLFWQFIAESALITFVAILLGLLLAAVMLPVFNQLTDRALQLNIAHSSGLMLLLLFVIFLIITFLAGTYPAVFLSAFQPVKVLKKSSTSKAGGGVLRKGLVIFQFAISAFFIVCTIIVLKQRSFIEHKDLGLDRSFVMVMDVNGKLFDNMDAVKNSLLTNSVVRNVSASYDSPLDVGGGYSLVDVQGKPPDFEMNVTAIPIDKDFARTMSMHLIAGTDLTDADIKQVRIEGSKPYENIDKRYYHFLLNESAVAALGWKPAEAIGKKVNLNNRVGEIKGVIKDFHFVSLHQSIAPIVMFPDYDYFGKLLVKVNGTDIKAAETHLQKTWHSFFPTSPFEYHFLDQEFEQQYRAEERTNLILNSFAFITILISCLGLLGLSAFTAEQRTKEIGIRKVLGASVSSIVQLLSADFMKLVIIAIVIASPIAWWAMNSWLQNFAYRINISWWMFALAGMIAILIALFTISFQAIKAAIANPVKSLKTE